MLPVNAIDLGLHLGMPALDQEESSPTRSRAKPVEKDFLRRALGKASASAARASLRVVVTLRIHEMKGPIVRARHGCARASATGKARARPGEPTASSIIAARKRLARDKIASPVARLLP